ncbi:MAG: PAS domain S-box protein, partial [Chloroherpetonaceae bacterium]|nr:PAS domain S-box protein [Chloroherpetonaceae bacterium]
ARSAKAQEREVDGVSAEILNAIFQKIPDAILVLDAHSERILAATDLACQLYGYSRAEFRSLSLQSVSKDVRRCREAIERVLRGEDIGDFETVHRRKDGEEIALICKLSLLDCEGKPAVLSLVRVVAAERKCFVSDCPNSTPEKMAAFDLMLKTSQVGFYVLNLETGEAYVSPSYKAQLGYADDEFPNDVKSWENALHPDDKERAIETFEKLMRGEIEHFELLHRLRHKNGDYRWIICNSIALKNADGKPTKLVGIHTDITSARLKDFALRDSEEKFRKIFRQIPASVTIVDIETGRLLDVNEQFERIFEIPREEAIGRTFAELGLSPPPEHYAKILNCLEKGVPAENLELEFTTRSGKRRILSYSVDLISLMEKRCAITTTIDVTEQRQAQREKEKLAEQLFQAQKLETIGKLASGVAHDFNNVLGIVKMAAGVLRHKLSNPDFLRYVSTIEEAAERGVNISRQLLMFSRRQAPKMELVSARKIIEQVVGMLRHSIPKIIEIQTNFLTSNDWIFADSTQIYQAMLNLGVNARDAMPTGGLLCYETSQVSSSFMEARFGKKFEKPFLRVKVKDTGVGMSPEVKRRLFEPFFTTKPAGKGTGLGMSIVYDVVKSHDGFIEVESEPGKGATFLLYFPLARLAEEPKPETPPEKTILLVEDEANMREMMAEVLMEKHFRVVEAESGAEGLKIFLANPAQFDLVLADLNMPELSGERMLAEMKATKPDLKFAVVTGVSSEDSVSALNAIGAFETLRKPFSSEDLWAIVDRAFKS